MDISLEESLIKDSISESDSTSKELSTPGCFFLDGSSFVILFLSSGRSGITNEDLQIQILKV